ncbi:MAG: DUF1015 domain-containing protein [Lachnospiraceae bacterium]|nr:DUF1015 domain-containing protein [Lachnospiraceae bacterium]MDD7051059.1 DUF1015 domain-containing protein [Lachnospiraceae bacterium]MDY4097497.1 DUF1015 domain-containing protein [Lachnospiraceae bacterium]
MAIIRPFRGIRPQIEYAQQIAALPYDVYSSEEAREMVSKEPLSFLKVDRAETNFPPGQDIYAPCVYEKAGSILQDWMKEGYLLQEEKKVYYLYELTMKNRVQTGIVAVASVDDYNNQIIKKHENTRSDKELDRIRHIDGCGMQTGPIFLAYRDNQLLNSLVEKAKQREALYDFTKEDGVRHRVFVMDSEEEIKSIGDAFQSIDQIYIADGHHRCASAVKVCMDRRAANPAYTGEEEYNYFLSVLFPQSQLEILDYNRVVKDLNGLTEEQFLDKLSQSFQIEKQEDRISPGKKGQWGMYLGESWYLLTLKEETAVLQDAVHTLDVSILQDYCLAPILGIENPKTDKRIDFIGGIRGIEELERRVHKDCKVAFSLKATSMEELFAVADQGLLMPPKSTWFEPKLRSGLFLHKI